MLYTKVLSTQAMSNTCIHVHVLEKAVQFSVRDQHDALVKIKYGKEVRTLNANFVC